MGRLDPDSILVVVDCSDISGRRREDLFMNSRDRMEQGEFLRAIEKELESILKEHPSLRELRERRRREDVASKLEDSKPFREVLQAILNKSPSTSLSIRWYRAIVRSIQVENIEKQGRVSLVKGILQFSDSEICLMAKNSKEPLRPTCAAESRLKQMSRVTISPAGSIPVGTNCVHAIKFLQMVLSLTTDST